MQIFLRDIVAETFTNASGYSFYLELKKHMVKGERVVVSFKDVSITSSSFLNSSFGAIIDEIGLDEFKRMVSPRDLSVTQAEVLLKYVNSFRRSSDAA